MNDQPAPVADAVIADSGLDPARRSLLASLRSRSAQHPVNGHRVLARTLADSGITHVYGIPGAPVDATFAACRAAGLYLVVTRHQQAAVFAAAAHNWIAGALKAVVIVSAGPGITNCTTGLIVARDNGWPLLVIGGRRSPEIDDRGGFQVLDGATLFTSITRKAASVQTTTSIATTVAELLRSSIQGRPAPCYVDVTVGALDGFEPERVHPLEKEQPLGRLNEEDTSIRCSEVLTFLAESVRPLLVFGDDLRFGPGFAAARYLAEHAGIPWMTSTGLRGLFSENHSLCATPVRHQLLTKADCVLMLGARLDWTLRYGASIPDSTRVLRFGWGNDVAVRERRAGIDHDADPSAVTLALSQHLAAGNLLGHRDEHFVHQLAGHRRQLQAYRDASRSTTFGPISPAQLMQEIGEVLSDHDRVILDGNLSMAWADRMIDLQTTSLRLTSGLNGCMGVGVPFGIAACLAKPGSRVLLIVGDFALGVALQDLETVIRYRLPLTIVLACNGGNAGRLRETEHYGREEPHSVPVYRFTAGIRYDQIMVAMGGQGEHISTPEAVRSALHRACTTNGPTLLQVDIQDDAPFPAF